jgi:predicted metal-binding membrane protein
MGNGPGAMGLGLATFLGVWTVMMIAMMTPTVTREIAPTRRSRAAVAADAVATSRVAQFAAGYLLVWVVAGVAALVLATGAGRLAVHHPAIATATAAVLLGAVGVYQLTPLKHRFLARCRHLSIAQTESADVAEEPLRTGLRHGLSCLASSGPLMVLLVVFGVMNIEAMVGLAAAVYAERTVARGDALSRLAGAILLALAVIVAVHPSFAPGLHASAVSSDMGM